MLARFAELAYPKGKTLSETIDGEQVVRVMIPLYYRAECLDCHGGPKGELDQTGHQKEGGKLGELGGAISVRLPVISQ